MDSSKKCVFLQRVIIIEQQNIILNYGKTVSA